MVKKTFLSLLLILVILAGVGGFLDRETSDDNTEIRLGTSLPLSGINKELGREILEGMQSYFDEVNRQGGIHGRSIRLIVYDDGYEPQNTLVNTRRLIDQDRVFALFSYVGTPTTRSILPLVDASGIPLIMPYTGASFLRDSEHPTVINLRSSYRDEMERLVDYLYRQGRRRFAIFYQNDAYGIEGYDAAVEALKKRNLQLIGEGTYRRNTLSVEHAVYEFSKIRPDAILIVGAYQPSARFIRETRKLYKQTTVFAPISFVNANALIEKLHFDGHQILFSQTVPSYNDSTLMEAKEFRRLLQRSFPKAHPTYAAFEAYLAARITVEALRRIPGTPTRQAFLESLRHLPPDTLPGIPLHYRKGQLLNQIYLTRFISGNFQPLEANP